MPEGTVQPKIALPELDYTLDDERNSLLNARLQQGATEGLWDTYNRLRLITTVRERHLLSALTQLSELRAAIEWVSVEERLPDVGMGILFDVPSCYGVEIGIWTGNKFVSERTSPYNDEVSWKPEFVTSWRNVPQPSPASAVKGE